MRGKRKAVQAAYFFRRYGQTGDLVALQRAISLFRELVRTLPSDDPNLPLFKCDLGSALRSLYENTHDRGHLKEALRFGREAVAAAPPGSAHRGPCLSNLGVTLHVAFETGGAISVLLEGIKVSREAVEATPETSPHRAKRLSYLGVALMRQFEATSDPEALREAVDVDRAALAAVRPGDPEMAYYKSCLGIALQLWWGVTGELHWLQQAVLLGAAAVQEVRGGDLRRAEYMTHLAGAWRLMFQRSGDLRDLREAVDYCRDAVAAAGPASPRRPGCMSDLGACLTEWFHQTGDREALAEALAAHQEAIAATPDGLPNLAGYLANLAITQRAQADLMPGDDEEYLGQLRAVAETSRRALRAFSALPGHQAGGHRSLPESMNSLAGALVKLAQETRRLSREADRAERPRESAELAAESAVLAAEAAELVRAALAAIPPASPVRAWYLSNLSAVLSVQSDLTGDPAALRESTQVARETAAATPPDHPAWARNQALHGAALTALAERTGDRQVLREARAALASLTRAEATGPMTRIMALRLRAHADSLDGDHQSALAAAEAAVDLLPQVIPRELRRQDREFRLGEMAGIGAQAAICALLAGQPDRAVELLEQARGVLLGEAMAANTDVARLRSRDPALAREFEQLRDRLAGLERAQPVFAADGSLGSQAMAQGAWHAARERAGQRQAADAEFQALVARIRETALADFLKPPTIGELQQEAGNGPVVIVIAAPGDRSAALILTSRPDQPVLLVPLPELTQEEATARAQLLHKALGEEYPDPDPVLRPTLTWLWKTTAMPVLNALGCWRPPGSDQRWLQLWWCPVGIMAHLPLHAAGYYEDTGVHRQGQAVIDHVVSSYTPTIRALAYARRLPEPGQASARGRSLIVAVPEAPGWKPIGGVDQEVSLLKKRVPDATTLYGPQATCRAVLKALGRSAVAHFACHGTSNWADPGASYLVLPDHEADPLTVAAISRENLPDARLAYLSACNTAQASPSLNDEAVHITAACQLAGFRNVIGTLWQASDSTAPNIANDVYACLTSGGSQPPDTEDTARALHEAIRLQRDRSPAEPWLWATYVHFGAGLPLVTWTHRLK